MISRWLAYAAMCAALLTFAPGCSSDSGGASFIQVLQISPEDGRSDVQVETRIGFQIDTLIDPAALNSDTFFVTDPDGNKVDGELIVDPDDGTIAVLTPTDPLEVITDYDVTITTEMLNTDGSGLEEDFAWSFMTLDAEWGTSEWIENTGEGSSSSQSVGVDAASNAMSVWEFNTGANAELNQIWASRYTRVELWDAPQQIDADNGDAREPALGLSAGGDAVAVWEDWARRSNGALEARIWANRYTLDEGWGTAEPLQQLELPAFRPKVASDADGNAIAIWVELEFPSNDQVVRARRYDASTGWGEIVKIDTESSGTVPEDLSIQFDADGNAIAMWTLDRQLADDFNTRFGVVWANRYVAGEGWQTAVNIKDDETTRSDTARLSVGAGGDAQVVWVQFTDAEDAPERGRGDIWGARYTPGSGWAAPVAVSEAPGAGLLDKRAPDVAVDGTGIAHVVWSQKERDDGGAFEDIYASRDEGSGWGAAVLVEPPNPDPREDGDATQPRVGTNATGNTFVVWRQDWEDWGSIWSNRIDPGEPWTPANTLLIEEIARPGQRPNIAVDDRRHAHAVWLHGVDTMIDRVRTNRFE